jgi:hypothetical protein
VTARRFPIMRPFGIDTKGRGLPKLIQWDSLNEEWAALNHGQSLDELARRGGLDPTEAAAIIQRRRWRPMKIDDALDVIEPFVAPDTEEAGR